jgi:hypothetical protein
MPTRSILPARRESVTQKIRVSNRRTLYLSTHAASPPLEIFIRIRGQDCTAEVVSLYDILARLTSLALQYGCPRAVGRNSAEETPSTCGRSWWSWGGRMLLNFPRGARAAFFIRA